MFNRDKNKRHFHIKIITLFNLLLKYKNKNLFIIYMPHFKNVPNIKKCESLILKQFIIIYNNLNTKSNYDRLTQYKYIIIK